MDLWKYQELSDFSWKLTPKQRVKYNPSTFESLCATVPDTRLLLSQLYELLLGFSATQPPYFIREWEKELETAGACYMLHPTYGCNV